MISRRESIFSESIWIDIEVTLNWYVYDGCCSTGVDVLLTSLCLYWCSTGAKRRLLSQILRLRHLDSRKGKRVSIAKQPVRVEKPGGSCSNKIYRLDCKIWNEMSSQMMMMTLVSIKMSSSYGRAIVLQNRSSLIYRAGSSFLVHRDFFGSSWSSMMEFPCIAVGSLLHRRSDHSDDFRLNDYSIEISYGITRLITANLCLSTTWRYCV